MFDTFQKLFLVGLGATATTAEAVRKSLDELVEKGKITADEAREYSQKMMNDGKKEFDDAQKEAEEFFNSMLSKARVATKKDIEELENKITSLKGRVTHLEKEAKE